MASQRGDSSKRQAPEGESPAARRATNAPGYVQSSAHPPSPRKYLINAGIDSQIADVSAALAPGNLGKKTGGGPVGQRGGDARSTHKAEHLFGDFSD